MLKLLPPLKDGENMFLNAMGHLQGPKSVHNVKSDNTFLNSQASVTSVVELELAELIGFIISNNNSM